MMQSAQQTGSGRVYGLDIFRSVAILLVVAGHGGMFLTGTWLEHFPFIRMIDGVDMFFVLSGFLIGGILLKEVNKPTRFGIKQMVSFWKRRWFRTLPNYYLILAVNYIIVRAGLINEDISQFSWRFLVFLQNFSKPFTGFFWESWSLTIEEWFYLLSPVLLLGSLRFLSPKRSFLFVSILMLLVPVVLRTINLDPYIDEFWYDNTFRKLVIFRLDSISYGLLASWMFYYYPKSWTSLRLLALAAGVSMIVFIVNFEAAGSSFYKQVLYFTLTPIAAMLLLPFAESIKKGKPFFMAVFTHISKISYSMYLINLAVVAEVMQHNVKPAGQTAAIVLYFLYWTLVISLSTLLYRYFEKPLMDLRDRKLF